MAFSRQLLAWLLFGLSGNGVLMPAVVAQPLECSSANIDLFTQADVDAFQSNFGNGGTCRVVTGNLRVLNNSSITNLDGLRDLNHVDGALSLVRNTALSNIDGLGAINSVGAGVFFDQNPGLTNVDALSGLTSVGGDLWFALNPALTNLDGLSGITIVNSLLRIVGNDALTQIDGLSAITRARDVVVSQNQALTNLDGLRGLTSVRNLLFVENNTSLADCSALASVLGWPIRPHNADSDFVGENVSIRDNAAGALSPDDCLNAFEPNLTAALFDERQAFLEITDVQEASGAYAVLNNPNEPFVSGDVAFSTGSESSLNFANWSADFEGDNNIELALNGVEDLDIQSQAGLVFALGVDFDDESGGASPSTFTVTLLRNGGELFEFEFITPPSEGRNFIGVRSNVAFDTLRIREAQVANENEYFGTVFTSSTEVNDGDSDGLFDDRDSCNSTPSSETVDIDTEGCGPSERDTDGDGVVDSLDAFPLDPAEQNDSDGDGFGDNQEIEAGSDPNDAGDVPGLSGLPVWLLFEANQ
ncbi:MAG: thrombospondin type 3 repeat-containing protein [Pseudomonadota bacterium]